MVWDENLESDGPHYQIACSHEKHVRVRAGPGTGKTYAMMKKIARLIEIEGVNPSKILAISFTRTAVVDLVDQLNRLGTQGADEVTASTLHSLAFKILKKNHYFECTGRNPNPLLNFEKECMLSDLGTEYGGKRKAEKLLKGFETYWARLQHEDPGWTIETEEKNFETDLLSWLTYHEAMLIGELIPKTFDFLRTNPYIAELYRYEHVLVDEYQDLNRAEQELIELFSSNGTLTVIGDENQSIYSFKHANPEGILNFHSSHDGTKDIPLLECKRCPKNVLKLAEDLIRHNSNTEHFEFYSSQGNCEGDIHIVQHGILSEEIQNISDYIDWYLKTKSGANLRDILVLSNSRQIGYSIRDKLTELGHSAQSYFSEEPLDKQFSQEGICILKLLLNPDDRVALRAWLGMGKADHRAPTYIRLRRLAEEHNLSPRDTLEQIITGNLKFNVHSSDILEKYDALKDKLSTYNEETGEALIEFLWSSNESDCRQIIELSQNLLTDSENKEDFFSHLIGAITQPELPKGDEEIIRVMSLHKSKGLTAKCVLVVGCNSGLLPRFKREDTPEEKKRKLEEQRRLFYVAITRTKETLVLSHSRAISPISATYTMGVEVMEKQFHVPGGVAILRGSQFLSEMQQSQKIESITGHEWRERLNF